MTPSRSATPMREPAGPSLWTPFDRPDDGRPVLQVWDGDTYVPLTWSGWRREAERIAAGLQRHGVAPGDTVAVLFGSSAASCAAVLGAWLAGARVASLPLIGRGMTVEAYREQLTGVLTECGPALVATEAQIAGMLGALGLTHQVHALEDLAIDAPARLAPVADDTVAFVQYSSGSTARPKGCQLTAGAIGAQLALLEEGLEVDPHRDHGAVWLPLSHDMGMFGGLLLSYWTRHPVAIGTPQRFVTDPWSWVRDSEHFGATLSAMPNFALALLARIGARRPNPRLRMRHVVVGGEHVAFDTLQAVAEALGPEGLPLAALRPAYGLAEGTLAVTMTRGAYAGPRLATLDAEALAAGELLHVEPGTPGATSFVSNGSPLPGVTVRAGTTGVGEVVVDSPSLACGYEAAPELTRERFGPEGFRTGDLGWTDGGELYLAGRMDDVLVVAGRNVYARDIERAMTGIGGVRPGGCAVVSAADSTRVVGLVEWKQDPDAGVLRDVAHGVNAAARAASGVAVDDVVFLRPGTLPKTPSGKLQRFRCRAIAANPGDHAVDQVRLTAR